MYRLCQWWLWWGWNTSWFCRSICNATKCSLRKGYATNNNYSEWRAKWRRSHWRRRTLKWRRDNYWNRPRKAGSCRKTQGRSGSCASKEDRSHQTTNIWKLPRRRRRRAGSKWCVYTPSFNIYSCFRHTRCFDLWRLSLDHIKFGFLLCSSYTWMWPKNNWQER